MSIKKYFGKKKKNFKHLPSTSLEELAQDVESTRLVKSYTEDEERFVPPVDFSDPANFAKFGSAESYYDDAIKRIYNQYPYDGSRHEVMEWYNSSSYIDLYMFEQEYPRTNGYIKFAANSYGTVGQIVDDYGSSSLAEYIFTKGGPHKDNIYDLSKHRDSNLRFGGSSGNAVEFWLKKSAFDTAKTKREVIFDVVTTSSVWTSSDYGRLSVELTASSHDLNSGFLVTYMSGTSGFATASLGSNLGTGSIADDSWHHYAISFDTVRESAIKFDNSVNEAGSSTYLDMEHDFWPWLSATPEYAISLWFRRDNTPSQNETLFLSATNALGSAFGTGGIIYMQASTGRLYTIFGGDNTVISSTNYADGDWHHVTLVVYDNGGAKYKVYVDGVVVKGETAVDTDLTDEAGAAPINDHFYIGGLYYESNWTSPALKGFDGYLDEISIWNAELEAGDVLELYNNGVYLDLRNHSKIANLSNWWKMGSNALGAGPNYQILDEIGSNSGHMINFSHSTGSSGLLWEVSKFNNHPKAVLYLDGDYNDTYTGGNPISPVSGALISTIGALAAPPSGTLSANLGWGKLSASIDEFRFWKTSRNSRDVGTNWFGQVGGGTNTDDANTSLGVYYKFNEGITATSSIDMKVLDYSGRISNGDWIGYSSVSRYTGSAMVEAGKVPMEYKDPIIYSTHPDVLSLYNTKILLGKKHDYENNAALYNTFPEWIVEEENRAGSTHLKNLTQMMASYFDTLWMQIESLPNLKDNKFITGSFAPEATGSIYKPMPFSDRLLSSMGFSVSELFADADAVEYFLSRGDDKIYKDKIYNVKNLIYQNIYNNLTTIYKSKGTEKAFRNLIRCFGIDDELIRLNIYADNYTFEFEDTYRQVTTRKNYVDFNHPDRYGSTIYQYESDTDHHLSGAISGSQGEQKEIGLPMTAEAEFFFPKKAPRYNPLYKEFTHTHASLFGIQSTSSLSTAPSFNIFAVRPSFAGIQGSSQYTDKDAYFKVTGTMVPLMTSSVYKNVYDNSNWNISLRLKPQKDLNINVVSGSDDVQSDYDLVFSGINSVGDTIYNEFFLTSSIARSQALELLTTPKKVYAGALRTEFSSSVVNYTDVKVGAVRYWIDYLSDRTLRMHARDVLNYGTLNPYRSAFLSQKDISGSIPQMDTLALHWDFETIATSDASGQFSVPDVSSGSSELMDRYGWLGDIAKRQHLARADHFPANSTDAIQREYIYSGRQQKPEVLLSSDMVSSRGDEDKIFKRNQKENKFLFAFEKSMYQTISEEMLKFMSSVIEFNNLIGEPVNKYRPEYKSLAKLRQLFFERIENTPDLDKFVSYYKWIDSAVGDMLMQLVPASAQFSDGLRTMIESHILERSKYHHKFPTLESKQSDPIGHIKGINELTYDWEYGHAPPSEKEYENCLWWKERAEKDGTTIPLSATGSGDTGVDSDRKGLQSVITTTAVSGSGPLLATETGTTYRGSTYAVRRFTKPYKLKIEKSRLIHGGVNFDPNKKPNWWKTLRPGKYTGYDGTSEWALRMWNERYSGIDAAGISRLKDAESCTDEYALRTNKNKKVGMKMNIALPGKPIPNREEGNTFIPFNIISSSFATGSNDGGAVSNHNLWVRYAFNGQRIDSTRLTDKFYEVTNAHSDMVGESHDVPMQGPFTEKWVGGNQHRHIPLNDGTSQMVNRPEAWFFQFIMHGGTGGNAPYGFYLHGPGGNILRSTSTHFGGAVNADERGNAANDAAPRAMYYRDETAKRPVNIKNIRTITGSVDFERNIPASLGNYTRDYEIVQTSGRSVNNRFFVKAEGITVNNSAVPNQTIISGVMDHDLTERTSGSINKYIFVERFSAPGGPEVMSRGFLDVESEEKSVYNELNQRNLSVRGPLQSMLRLHSGKYGFYNNAQTTASYHKIYRNPRRTIHVSGTYPFDGDHIALATGTSYDNWYVQRPIPQSDMNYAWITSSITGNASQQHIEALGYWPADFTISSSYPATTLVPSPQRAVTGLTSNVVNFVSASDIGIYDTGNNLQYYGVDRLVANAFPFMAVDFAGMNSLIYEPISSSLTGTSENILGYPPDAFNDYNTDHTATRENYVYQGGLVYRTSHDLTYAGFTRVLNGIIHHRGGAHGWPSWKQIRGAEHPIARYHKKHNILSIIGTPKKHGPTYDWHSEPKQLHGLDNTGKKTQTTSEVITNYEEGPVTSRFKPITHGLVGERQDNTLGVIVIDHSYGNNLVYFIDETLDDKFHLVKTRKQKYDELYELYGYPGVQEEQSPVKKFSSITYKETIFPKEQNSYKVNTNTRADYLITFWKDSRHNRHTLGEFEVGDVGDVTGSNPGYALTSSIWALDGRLDYDTSLPWAGTSGSHTSWKYAGTPEHSWSAGAGILQNHWTHFHSTDQWFMNEKDERLGKTTGFRNRTVYLPLTSALINYARPTWEYNTYDVHKTQRHGNGVAGGAEVLKHVWMPISSQPWTAPVESGLTPNYSSYEEYIDPIKRLGKDFSVLPEFNISEHMEHFVIKNDGNFRAKNKNWLSLKGAPISSSGEDGFYETYSHTDFLKFFDVVFEDHKEITNAKSITLKCKAITRLLPYNGFFPAQRTVQLAEYFSQSYGSKLLKTGDEGHYRTLAKPFFGPGLLFNSIKSGVAVDWPVHESWGWDDNQSSIHVSKRWSLTGSGTGNEYIRRDGGYNSTGFAGAGVPMISGNFNARFPFEALVEPEQYLNGQWICDDEPHPSASLASKVQIAKSGAENELYRLAMHNFLAESVDFYIKGGQLTSFVSADDKSPSHFFFNASSSIDCPAYVMDVVFYRNSDLNVTSPFTTVILDSEIANANYTAKGYNTFEMYDRASAFGPPVNHSILANDSTPFHYTRGPGWDCYTPPYYHGKARARIIFYPTDSKARKYTLSEVLSSISTPPNPSVAGEQSGIYYTRNAWANFGSPLGQTGDGQSGGGIPHREDFFFSGSGWNAGINQFLFAVAENNQTNSTYKDYTLTDNRQNAMQISASLNMLGAVKNKSIEYDPITNLPIAVKDDTTQGDKWVIQTKWESPVLNFKNAATSSVTWPDTSIDHSNGHADDHAVSLPYGTGSFTKGMWHQYGAMPEKDGFFVQIMDPLNTPYVNGSRIPTEEEDVLTSAGANPDAPKPLGWGKKVFSLADRCGFQKSKPSAVGKIRSSKTISEAVIAVPFFEDEGKRYFATIPRPLFDAAVEMANGKKDQAPMQFPGLDDMIPGQSIINMVEKMQRYVLPSWLNALFYKESGAFHDIPAGTGGVEPIMMYIFEFSRTFDRQDLADMWQNLLPEKAKQIKIEERTITHKIDQSELLGPWVEQGYNNGGHLSNIQWMVFKVKQKAKWNYYEKTLDSADDTGFKFKFKHGSNDGTKATEPDYNFNWPYDYCSLVESIKMDADIDMYTKSGEGIDIPKEYKHMTPDEKKLMKAAKSKKATQYGISASDEEMSKTKKEAEQEGMKKSEFDKLPPGSF